MVSSFMLIVDPALLVKVVMEVVVDSGWMVFPPTPAPVCKHMLTLPCPVCWCIIPGEESEHLRGSGRTELISPNTKKFPIWNGSCWMTLFKQRHQLQKKDLSIWKIIFTSSPPNRSMEFQPMGLFIKSVQRKVGEDSCSDVVSVRRRCPGKQFQLQHFLQFLAPLF